MAECGGFERGAESGREGQGKGQRWGLERQRGERVLGRGWGEGRGEGRERDTERERERGERERGGEREKEAKIVI